MHFSKPLVSLFSFSLALKRIGPWTHIKQDVSDSSAFLIWVRCGEGGRCCLEADGDCVMFALACLSTRPSRRGLDLLATR